MSNRGTPSTTSAPRTPHGTRFWTTRAAQGFIVGVTIATLECLYYYPLVSGPRAIDFGIWLSNVVIWSGECALFALVLGSAERIASPADLRAWQLASAVVVGVTASVIVWHAFTLGVLRDHLGMRVFREHLAQRDNWLGGALYHAWFMLFFGTLIAAVGASQRRRARMLSALRSAELNRSLSQQRLAAARLAYLEARIDPDNLHRELSRLERLYEEDAPAADRALDELIAYLRNALTEARGTITREIP